MGWRNTKRLFDAIEWEGASLIPAFDNVGTFKFGNGTRDWDVKWFAGSNTTLFDNSASLWINDGVDIQLKDDDELRLGDLDGGDFALTWNTTHVVCKKATDRGWDGAPFVGDPSPSVYHEFFDDFFLLDSAWTVTEDGGGATQAIADVAFGVLTLTEVATTDDSGSQVNYAQETFLLVDGKELWFEVRVRLPAGDATNLDFFVGLAVAVDLTGVADNMPANGIGFHKDDGDTNIDLSSSDNGTNIQQANVHTLVDNTWVRLAFHYDGGATGSGVITPYINGVAGTAITSTTYATQAEMAPLFLIRNGDATTTQVLDVDYVKVIIER